jgi:hypothetical protein
MHKNSRNIFFILSILSVVGAGIVAYYKLIDTSIKSNDIDLAYKKIPVHVTPTLIPTPQLKTGYTRFINPKYGFGFDYPEVDKLTVDTKSYTDMFFDSKNLNISLMKEVYSNDPKRIFPQTLLDADLGCTLDSVMGSISCDPDQFSLSKIMLKSGAEAYRIDRIKVYEGSGWPENLKPGSYKDHVYVIMLPKKFGSYIAVSMYTLNISPKNLDYLDQIADSFFFIQ